MVIYVVKTGDTVESIAAEYNVSVERLIFDNQLKDLPYLVVGQALLILIPRSIHRVAENDTIASVAEQYGLTVNQLLRNNPYLRLTSTLVPLEYLVISYEGQKFGELQVNGYAYPFINREVLRETLPYLTYLSVFSYGFNLDGELLSVEDEPLIAMAREYGVQPILVLTPFSESGTFNNNLVNAIVTNLSLQEQVIQNLLTTVAQKGYAGVDVDFEFVLAENREQYAAFVGNLTRQMNEQGYVVTVALAPKTSSDQKGLLYEGIDYELLGEAANQVLLMTYEWGYTYGPPMAVAPIPSVRRVLDYGVTVIPPEIINYGIPNYGYDWPLPYVRGVTAATTLGNVEAVGLALFNGASISYDEQAQSPYYYYTREETQHVVWFEDVRSMQAKFELSFEYGFLGVGYWQVMKLFRANWLLLNQMFDIISL